LEQRRQIRNWRTSHAAAICNQISRALCLQGITGADIALT